MAPSSLHAPGLTFREFAERLIERKLCSVDRIEDPTGDGTEALYRFVRVNPPLTTDVIEYVEDDTWPMTPTTFRSMCARIGIDPGQVIGTTH